MKLYLLLSFFAFAALAFAAVWLGGLNQDEGWYIYAAQLVHEGLTPYRDFDYTQGPLMPSLYASAAWAWNRFGLLGARILTCVLGLLGMMVAAGTARLLSRKEDGPRAAVVAFLLLGSNLYHIYYTTIPKTYALAALFVAVGYCLLSAALVSPAGARARRVWLVGSGLALAHAAGTRISLGALLGVCGFALLFSFRRHRWDFFWFGLGGAFGLAVIYGPYLLDGASFAGLCKAQRYHAERGGFDPVFTVGSLSRLVRWYLPVFVMLGMGIAGAAGAKDGAGEGTGGDATVAAERRFALSLLSGGFIAVFAVQMLAPFPYEDYQVPIMGLLAVVAATLSCRALKPAPLLALGLSWACSFGSPLLEKWTTNAQDRFWTVKKDKCELAQLRDAAKVIEAIDPGGKTLLTQDLYLAVETGRKVPKGLEMGPFSVMEEGEWRNLLETVDCPVAALSGYTFAIEPPKCNERDFDRQMEFWRILKKRYGRVGVMDDFGQNATSLVILKRIPDAAKEGAE